MIEKKITLEELKELQEIQELYSKITASLGNLEVQKINFEKFINRLNQQKIEIMEEYSKIQQRDEALSILLNKNYGEGSVDSISGVFTPN